MGPVVSVVVLVKLSGMGYEWEHASLIFSIIFLMEYFFMTHDDGVQEKKTCMGPVVSVVVLVELSGMGCEWEHASIVVM